MAQLTKRTIGDMLNETVDDVLKRIGIINEYAIPLKVYRARVDGLRFQLVENWCLCRWCQLFNPNNENFKHWITELRACINNLKLLNVKEGINKKRILRNMLIRDYDYDTASMIGRIIKGKFRKEKISNTNQKVRVCADFANNINGLIDAISIDSIDTDEYIEHIFNSKSC